ncbi:MAG: diguanylate cyclase [Desulfobacter sp.]|nr:MAG: diguanylate cyclase [Desulfobacter sp.]
MNRIEINNIDTLRNIIQHLNIGVAALDEENRVVAWNLFLAEHSNITAKAIMGRDIFEVFPDLPRPWMELKLRSVRLIKNYSFVSWTRRPYLFRFKNKDMMQNPHIEYMHQDCTFIPVTDTDTGHNYVCITITDMTESAASHFELAEIRDINKTLEQMTSHDGLTALYNKAYIENQANLEFNRAKRYNTPFSIVFFDIDHFKKVNDTYGHLGGDEVLKDISRLIDNRLRETDFLGRYGGEEFLLLLPETKEAQAILLAERMRQAVEEAVTWFEDREIRVTISLGLVEFRPDIKSHLQMIHEADIALYHSKANGRNTVSRYGEDGSVSAASAS